MSEIVILEATRREVTGKKVKALRREGKLPAVIYGVGVNPTPIVLDQRDATNSLRSVTSATLVSLTLDGETHTALVRERQYDIIRREMNHVDFLAIAMNELLRASVPLRLIGLAPAIKEYSAMIMQEAESLEVEALPRNLPEFIEVDVSKLEELGDMVTAADLNLGDGVQILGDSEMVIAVAIHGVRLEEEEEEEIEDEFAEDVEPELIERGKREEEEEEA